MTTDTPIAGRGLFRRAEDNVPPPDLDAPKGLQPPPRRGRPPKSVENLKSDALAPFRKTSLAERIAASEERRTRRASGKSDAPADAAGKRKRPGWSPERRAKMEKIYRARKRSKRDDDQPKRKCRRRKQRSAATEKVLYDSTRLVDLVRAQGNGQGKPALGPDVVLVEMTAAQLLNMLTHTQTLECGTTSFNLRCYRIVDSGKERV